MKTRRPSDWSIGKHQKERALFGRMFGVRAPLDVWEEERCGFGLAWRAVVDQAIREKD